MTPGGVIVVVDKAAQQPKQVPLVEHDHVVEQVAAEGAEQTLDARVTCP
jgi:hypothetical protein